MVSSAAGQTRTYTVAAHFSDLPVIYMDTPSPITSKTEWTEGCTLQLCHAGQHNILLPNTSVRGRGNSTWAAPKKPYAIKLNTRTGLFGMPAHKRWVLLANYFDPTHLRSEMGFFLSRMSRLAYTPRSVFAEVVVNGRFEGLYQMTEQLKIDANRVNAGDGGVLLEIDQRADAAQGDVFFRADNISYPIVIKDPDTWLGSDLYNRTADYVKAADKVLLSENFRDPATGYRAWLDAASFAEWYLVNEISKNNDSGGFFSSCYMMLPADGKLTMGPVWDFDIAFGNVDINGNDKPEGLWVLAQTTWFRRLFEDPWFVALVKERFAYYDANRSLIYRQMAMLENRLGAAVAGNNYVWDTLGGGHEDALVLFEYHYKVAELRKWIDTRMDWLRDEFAKM